MLKIILNSSQLKNVTEKSPIVQLTDKAKKRVDDHYSGEYSAFCVK